MDDGPAPGHGPGRDGRAAQHAARRPQRVPSRRRGDARRVPQPRDSSGPPLAGSVGMGDITILPHIGLAMIGEWDVDFGAERMKADRALASIHAKPLVPYAKDALAITSSNAYAAGMAALLLHDLGALLETADVVFALSLEGLNGNVAPLFEAVNAIRGYRGQIGAAEATPGPPRRQLSLAGRPLAGLARPPELPRRLPGPRHGPACPGDRVAADRASAQLVGRQPGRHPRQASARELPARDGQILRGRGRPGGDGRADGQLRADRVGPGARRRWGSRCRTSRASPASGRTGSTTRRSPTWRGSSPPTTRRSPSRRSRRRARRSTRRSAS